VQQSKDTASCSGVLLVLVMCILAVFFMWYGMQQQEAKDARYRKLRREYELQQMEEEIELIESGVIRVPSPQPPPGSWFPRYQRNDGK
jgi:hypothetical protein